MEFIRKPITRRTIQIGLGVLWLVDGFLQLQPQMFTANFANDVIAPSAQGQPILIAGPIHFFIHVFLLHPAIFNSFSAITQLAIGALILWKRTTKIGLLGSIGWGLFVWLIGEGLGGLFTWHTLILMGEPGAVILYVILAIAVYPQNKKKVAKQDLNKPAVWLPLVWAFLWLLGGIYQLLPGQNSVSNVSSMIAGNAAGQPGWLASLDSHVSSYISSFSGHSVSIANMHMSSHQMLSMQTQTQTGYWFIVLLAFIQIGIGIGIFLPRKYRNLAIGLGIALSLIFWVVGQSFGDIFSGLATDLNSAVLYILLGVAILGCDSPKKFIYGLFDKVESVLT